MRQLRLSIKIKSTVGERTDANEVKARDAFDFYLLLRAMIAAPLRAITTEKDRYQKHDACTQIASSSTL